VVDAQECYSRFLKRHFTKQLEERAYALSNTSLFKGISALNVRRLMPYFFVKGFHKFGEVVYRQEDRAEFVYWIVEGEVELIKEDLEHDDAGNKSFSHGASKHVCKIVKLSKS
jgi:CRP-like cAMP-binding protein